MINPLAALEQKIEEDFKAAEARLFLAIRVAILREDAAVILSRLSTLDESRPADYLSAIRTIA